MITRAPFEQGVTAVILGIPLGIAMINLLTASLGDSMDIPGRCDIKYIVLSAVITVIISAAVNSLFSGRIKNMNMVKETKSAE